MPSILVVTTLTLCFLNLCSIDLKITQKSMSLCDMEELNLLSLILHECFIPCPSSTDKQVPLFEAAHQWLNEELKVYNYCSSCEFYVYKSNSINRYPGYKRERVTRLTIPVSVAIQSSLEIFDFTSSMNITTL